MTVGWGVVGTGNHADMRMAPAIAKANGAKLVGVQSRDLERAKAFAAKHGGENAYDSIEGLLADPGVDVVYVASPNGLHAAHTIQAANAGKHIFVDKPMATSAADCQRMIDAAAATGVLLGVGFNQRFQPAHVAIREILAKGELGRIVMIKIECAAALAFRLKEWWYDAELAGAGGLMATGSHAIDQVRWLTGDEVVSVAGFTDVDDTKAVDDVAAATMRTAGGIFVQLTCGRKLPYPVNNITIHGENGQLQTKGTMIYDIGGGFEISRPDLSVKRDFRPPRAGYDIFTAEVEQFSRAVVDGTAPTGTGEDGMICTRIIEAIQESSRTGATIKLSV